MGLFYYFKEKGLTFHLWNGLADKYFVLRLWWRRRRRWPCPFHAKRLHTCKQAHIKYGRMCVDFVEKGFQPLSGRITKINKLGNFINNEITHLNVFIHRKISQQYFRWGSIDLMKRKPFRKWIFKLWRISNYDRN